MRGRDLDLGKDQHREEEVVQDHVKGRDLDLGKDQHREEEVVQDRVKGRDLDLGNDQRQEGEVDQDQNNADRRVVVTDIIIRFQNYRIIGNHKISPE